MRLSAVDCVCICGLASVGWLRPETFTGAVPLYFAGDKVPRPSVLTLHPNSGYATALHLALKQRYSSQDSSLGLETS